MTVPDQPQAATPDAPQPLTVGSLAVHLAEQVPVENHVAATPLTAEHVAAMAAASAASTATPATPEAWAPYIPDHGFAPAAVTAACTCPDGGRGGSAEFQVHIAGCEQGLEGTAQPFGDAFCAEFDFEPVAPIDAVTFGAKLRGITPGALADAMALEAEDREFDVLVRSLRGDQPSITDVEWSATVARRQRAREDTDLLLNELRWIVTKTEYDDVLDGLSMYDPFANVETVRARIAWAESVKHQLRPPRAGELLHLQPLEQMVEQLREVGDLGGVQFAEESLERLRRSEMNQVRDESIAAPDTGPNPFLADYQAAQRDPERAAEVGEQSTAVQLAGEARIAEEKALRSEILAYLVHISVTVDTGAAAADAELRALMDMTAADRTEALTAVKSGMLTRVGLRITDLDASKRSSAHAWTVLREGAAGSWAMRRAPLTDAELDALLSGEQAKPTIAQLFYDVGIHVLAGPPGCGKTWIALNACLSVVPALQIPGSVETAPFAVYLDLDGNVTMHQRAIGLGATREALKRRDVDIVSVPAEAHDRGQGLVATLWEMVKTMAEDPNPPRVVVIDSMSRVVAESGEDSNNSDGVTRIMNRLQPLADRCCVIVLDHTGHAEPDRPSGSVAKIGATRAVLTLREVEPDKEKYPNTFRSSSVVVTKDRDGGIAAHAGDGAADPKPYAGKSAIDKDPGTGEVLGAVHQRQVVPGVGGAAEQPRGTGDRSGGIGGRPRRGEGCGRRRGHGRASPRKGCRGEGSAVREGHRCGDLAALRDPPGIHQGGPQQGDRERHRVREDRPADRQLREPGRRRPLPDPGPDRVVLPSF